MNAKKKMRKKQETADQTDNDASRTTTKSGMDLRFQKQQLAELPAVTLQPPHLFEGKGKHRQGVQKFSLITTAGRKELVIQDVCKKKKRGKVRGQARIPSDISDD